MLRARATLDLVAAIDAELNRDASADAEAAAHRLLMDVEQPLSVVLAGMERTGIAADTDYLSELESHFAAEVKAAAQAAYAVVGREFNLGSPKQLQEILFVELGAAQDQAHQDRLHHRRRRAAGSVRPDRARRARAPAASPRRRQAEVHSGRSAQVGERRRAHPHHLLPDRRRHRPAVAAPTRTCRTCRSAPRRAGGSAARSPSAQGYEGLLTADYSQIEMRIMAHMSHDEKLIEAFKSGADFHAVTASVVFSVPLEEIGPEHRRRVKAMNYGLAYGLSRVRARAAARHRARRRRGC